MKRFENLMHAVSSSRKLDCKAGRFGFSFDSRKRESLTTFHEVDSIIFFGTLTSLFLRNRVSLRSIFAKLLPRNDFSVEERIEKERERDDRGKNSSFVRDRFAEREWSFGGRRVEWSGNFKMDGKEWPGEGKKRETFFQSSSPRVDVTR